MRRLLEVGEILQAGDYFWGDYGWTKTQVNGFGIGCPVESADVPFYRNEPDGRAEMLAALNEITHCDDDIIIEEDQSTVLAARLERAIIIAEQAIIKAKEAA